MTRAKTQHDRWSLRYYVCSDDQITWRIPNTLHSDLVAGKLLLPQFASTKQKVLEVFVSRATGGPVLLEARGSIYSFDSDGRLDLHPTVEASANAVEGRRPRVYGNVIDIRPTVRSRRWHAEQTWKPLRRVLRLVQNDLDATRSSGRKVPLLRRNTLRRRP